MEKFLYLLVILSTLKESLSVQTWKEEPKYSEVNPQKSTILACKIFNKKGTCSWQKDGKPQGIFAGKVEWAGDRSSGDCSIRIFNASEIDNGEWECQVTASSFSARDALTSGIARLVVRVAPDAPVLEGWSQRGPHHNFTVRQGSPSPIKCVSRHGNPPARIKWFLGSEEILSDYYNQTNATEVDRENTYMAVSVLQTSYAKSDLGKSLRCVAVHEAYGMKSREISIILNVEYAPTVILQGAPTRDIEDGNDRVALQCLADANPQATIKWRRQGEDRDFSFGETLEFNPITKKNSGTYFCRAGNIVGESDPLSAVLDVKYPPQVLEVGPEPLLTATLHNHTRLQCEAEGNPYPNYKWIQVAQYGRKIWRGNASTLYVDNVTYDHQGQYFCQVQNAIKGKEQTVTSTAVILEVIGAPQVMRHTATQTVEVLKGDNAVIQMVFCSDPRPLKTTWQWGSLQLEAGKDNGRYAAEGLAQENGSKDCYQARLRVSDVSMTDERNYYLNVRNDKGEDRYSVALLVKEPVSMTTVIAIVVTCLIILVIVTLVIFYAFKAEKCCFSPTIDGKRRDSYANSTLVFGNVVMVEKNGMSTDAQVNMC